VTAPLLLTGPLPVQRCCGPAWRRAGGSGTTCVSACVYVQRGSMLAGGCRPPGKKLDATKATVEQVEPVCQVEALLPRFTCHNSTKLGFHATGKDWHDLPLPFST
jgi:hypothetical protein